MILHKYCPNPLSKPWGALLGMMERARVMEKIPPECGFTEVLAEDFWSR